MCSNNYLFFHIPKCYIHKKDADFCVFRMLYYRFWFLHNVQLLILYLGFAMPMVYLLERSSHLVSVYITLISKSPFSRLSPLQYIYIYICILRTWFFTGSQSPKSQMQAEGPCFPSSAAQRSWNSARQQNSDASGWQ